MRAGRAVCRAVVANGEACPALATCIVVFSDGQRAHVCGGCALLLRELAASHSPPAPLRIERLTT